MEILILLVVALAAGALTEYVAVERGVENPRNWFWIGLVLPLLGLIALLGVPSNPERAAMHKAERADRVKQQRVDENLRRMGIDPNELDDDSEDGP
ncbi:MAG TPA: hypothetical protein VGB52_10945 [Actinomycetota bacterium]